MASRCCPRPGRTTTATPRKELQPRLVRADTKKGLRRRFEYEALGLENTILTTRTQAISAANGQALDEAGRLLLGGVNLAQRLSVLDVILAEADRRGMTDLREQLAARVARTIEEGAAAMTELEDDAATTLDAADRAATPI